MYLEYFPSDIHSDVAEADWDGWFALRLRQLVQRFGVRVVVLDANVPFSGVLMLRREFPALRLGWVRRARWGQHPQDLQRLRAQNQFDLVIEPGDLAEDYDTGPTRALRHSVTRVPPILLHQADEALDRETACRALGLAPDTVNICLQLGAEVADNAVDLVAGVCEELEICHGVAPVWCRSILAPARPGLEALLPTARIFPLTNYMAAFDLAVSAAGYNTFHELHQARIPTVFVANTAPGMDNQAARAAFAASAGWGRLAIRTQISIMEALRPLLEPEERAKMRQHFDTRPLPNGAARAAQAILALAAAA
ncbi:MAG: hypothetical protein LAT78_08570 [Roseinatronobacter sp.]|nr:hypothetical protein [Roseinatronobacter sp.]